MKNLNWFPGAVAEHETRYLPQSIRVSREHTPPQNFYNVSEYERNIVYIMYLIRMAYGRSTETRMLARGRQ
jgi:hypothetical protein